MCSFVRQHEGSGRRRNGPLELRARPNLQTDRQPSSCSIGNQRSRWFAAKFSFGKPSSFRSFLAFSWKNLSFFFFLLEFVSGCREIAGRNVSSVDSLETWTTCSSGNCLVLVVLVPGPQEGRGGRPSAIGHGVWLDGAAARAPGKSVGDFRSRLGGLH